MTKHQSPTTGVLIEQAEFLCARLRDLEGYDGDELLRQLMGHVCPALSRLESALEALSRPSPIAEPQDSDAAWLTLECESAHYVDHGRNVILCDRLPRPVTLVVKLAARLEAPIAEVSTLTRPEPRD